MGGSVAVALVTRNAQAWIDQLLDSILAQTRQPDAIVIVDDHSTDDTLQRITRTLGSSATILHSTSTAKRGIDRIAENFTQAVRACEEHGAVILGDHDDIWFPDRIAYQASMLDSDKNRNTLMVASDGRLVDEHGVVQDGTLRSHFRLPHINRADTNAVLRLTLTHLVATGGASALRPSAFPTLDVPPGWLHDRWWSLLAAARGGLIIDGKPVIDYRLHQGQQAGLAQGTHGRSLGQKLRGIGPTTTIRKMRDISTRLRPLALPDLREELGLTALARTFASR